MFTTYIFFIILLLRKVVMLFDEYVGWGLTCVVFLFL